MQNIGWTAFIYKKKLVNVADIITASFSEGTVKEYKLALKNCWDFVQQKPVHFVFEVGLQNAVIS